jgi:hypothetical protein
VSETITFKDHAIIRMLERGIARSEILEVINLGEIIEDYFEDYPYPSCLMFKIVNFRPLHVVVAHNITESQRFVVTTYIPDLTKFEADFKTRK